MFRSRIEGWFVSLSPITGGSYILQFDTEYTTKDDVTHTTRWDMVVWAKEAKAYPELFKLKKYQQFSCIAYHTKKKGKETLSYEEPLHPHQYETKDSRKKKEKPNGKD